MPSVLEFFVVGGVWFWALLAIWFFFLTWVVEQESLAFGKAFFATVAVLSLIFASNVKALQAALAWLYAHPLAVSVCRIAYFMLGAAYVVAPYVGKWWCFVRNIRELNRVEKAAWLASWQKKAARSAKDVENYDISIASEETAKPAPGFNAPSVMEHRQKRIATLHEERLAAAVARDMWAESKGEMTPALLGLWKDYEKTVTVTNHFGQRLPIAKPVPEQHKARIIAWIAYWPPSLCWTLLNDPFRHISRIVYDGVADWLQHVSDEVWKNEDTI
jgi:hypothetical protein